MLHSLRLYNTGFCFQREFLLAGGGRMVTVAIPVYVAVLQHPTAGTILFDTGYAGHYFDATQHFPFRMMSTILPVAIKAKWTIAAQLAASGIAPAEVQWIMLSHLHNDHVAGLKDFPSAKIVCKRSGYYDGMLRLSDFNQARKGFLPALLPDDFEARSTFIEDLPAMTEVPPFGPCVDFLGDGSILFIPLEGHCRGQIGALLTMADGRQVLLAADACYLSRSLRTGKGPPWITQLAADDPKAAQLTLDRLRQFGEAHPEVPVIPSHCGEAAYLYPEWFVEKPVYEGRPVAGVEEKG